MHVLMIGAGDPPATFIRRHIEALEAEGITVSLWPELRRYKRWFINLCQQGFTFHIPRTSRNLLQSADILHFQWPGHLLNYYALADNYHKPAVLSLRGRQINIVPYMPGSARYVSQLMRLLPRCQAYHCVSADIMREGEAFGLDATKAWVIHTVVDTELFYPAPVRPALSPVHIIMIGALIWRKGYEYALQAVNLLRQNNPDIHLTIVGEGVEQERVTCTIADLGLQDFVTLAGQMPVAQVRQTLQNSHLLLHAGLSEGIANVVIEAMACGLPVVATEAGGMNEAITDGVEGFLVPVRDVALMSQRLEVLVQQPALREVMGQRARQRVLRDFDQREYGRKFREMYEAVLREC